MVTTSRSLAVIAVALAALAAAACTRDEDPLFRERIEDQTVMVGGGGADQVVRLGTTRVVELIIPGDVVPVRASVTVSLVTGVVRKGAFPVNESGVLVQPENLTFTRPVRVRQYVSPPPPGRRYVAVVVPDGERAFVTRGPARRVDVVDPTWLEPGELWEADGEGSGLWGLALVEGAGPDGGQSVDAGADATTAADATPGADASAEERD